MSNIEERLDKVRELIQEPVFFVTIQKMKWQSATLLSNWKPTILCPAV